MRSSKISLCVRKEGTQKIDFTEFGDNATHQSAFSECLFHAIECRMSTFCGTASRCDRRDCFPEEIECTIDTLFGDRDSSQRFLHCYETRVDNGNREHHDAVNDSGRDLTETTEHEIVRLLTHDTMFISLRTGIESKYCSSGTKVFDEGIPRPGRCD